MFIKVNFNTFDREFRNIARATQFPKCLEALFDYLTEMEDDDNDVELDVIALCCEYTEYETIFELLHQYPDLRELDIDDKFDFEKTLQNLQKHTTVIGNTGDETEPFIIQNF